MANDRFTVEAKDISLLHSFQTDSGAHRASYPVATGLLSPGIKWQGREIEHSSPSSDELKNGGALPPLPRTSHAVMIIFLSTGTGLHYFSFQCPDYWASAGRIMNLSPRYRVLPCASNAGPRNINSQLSLQINNQNPVASSQTTASNHSNVFTFTLSLPEGREDGAWKNF